MNIIFERLSKLYQDGVATDITIANAVVREWITAEDYKTITGKEYSAK